MNKPKIENAKIEPRGVCVWLITFADGFGAFEFIGTEAEFI